MDPVLAVHELWPRTRGEHNAFPYELVLGLLSMGYFVEKVKQQHMAAVESWNFKWFNNKKLFQFSYGSFIVRLSLECSNDSTVKGYRYFRSHMNHSLSGWGQCKAKFCVLNIHVLLHSFLFPVSINFFKKNVDIENTTLNPSQFSPLMRQGLWGSQQMPWGWVVDNRPPLSLPQAHPLPRWDCEPSHSCRRNDLEAALTCHPKNIQGKFLAMFMQNTARCFDHSYWNIQIIQSCTICNYFEIKLFEIHI